MRASSHANRRHSATLSTLLFITCHLISGFANASPPPAPPVFSSAGTHSTSQATSAWLNLKNTTPQNTGVPVYIQIFKEEGILELYSKSGDHYQLLHSYPICKFSGGLGPKQRPGDLKSPEGFYSITQRQLNPNSKFYKSMDIGFPNDWDRSHGYQGRYLMIHGACVSQGCYAMTDQGIEQVYRYVHSALAAGQQRIEVSIFPFRMTDDNMRRHKYSHNLAFWQQLKPGYDYFLNTKLPPVVSVDNGYYVVGNPPTGKASFASLPSTHRLSEME